MRIEVDEIVKNVPIIAGFALVFVAVVFFFKHHSKTAVAEYGHTVELTANLNAYDFADCVINQNKGHPKKSMRYLGRATIYGGPPSGDFILQSRDKSILVKVNTVLSYKKSISIIAKFESKNDINFMESIKKCAY